MKYKAVNKLLSLLLATFIIMLAAAPCFAEDTTFGKCGPNLYWNVADKLLTISGYGEMYDYDTANPAPWKKLSTSFLTVVVEEGCTKIGSYAFYQCTKASKIELPKYSLRYCGDYSFSAITNLKSIELPDSITELGENILASCPLLSAVKLPSGITKIPTGAFTLDKALKSVNLPKSCKALESRCFYQCIKLASIDLTYVEAIYANAFNGCEILSEVTFGTRLRHIESCFNNCPLLANVSLKVLPDFIENSCFLNTAFYNALPEGPYTMLDGRLLFCKGAIKESSYTIPEKTVVVAGHALASSTTLSSVTIPSGVRILCDGVFHNDPKLKSVTIPDTVRYVGDKLIGYLNNGTSTVPLHVDDLVITTPVGSAAYRYAIDNHFWVNCLHEYSDVSEIESCTDGGYKYERCIFCSYNKSRTPIAPSSHSFKTTTVEATCTEDGYTEAVCTKCYYSEITGTVKATGHSSDGKYTIESFPTCTTDGSFANTCTKCGYTFERYPIPAKGHTPAAEYTEIVRASCKSEGVKVKYCTVCSAVCEYETAPVTEHAFADYTAVTKPDDKFGVYGYSIRICPYCNTAYDSRWTDESGNTYNTAYAVSTNITVIKSYISGKTKNCGITLFDYNTDGRISAADIMTLKLLDANV